MDLYKRARTSTRRIEIFNFISKLSINHNERFQNIKNKLIGLKAMSEQTVKILKLNLIIYFGVSIIELIIVMTTMYKPDDAYRGIFFMILSMFSIGFQIFIDAILSIFFFFTQKKELGKSYLLSLLVVLLIGFPLCFGGLFLGR